MRRTAPMKLGLYPKPRFGGEQFNGQPALGLAKLCRRTRANNNKKILELPFDFGAAHARCLLLGD